MRDKEVLVQAANEGRILVTHDQKTMPKELAQFLEAASSPGVIIVPQHLPASSVAEDLILIWTTTAAEEWANRILYLPI
jgi:predicted amino acid dehydrogenase